MPKYQEKYKNAIMMKIFFISGLIQELYNYIGRSHTSKYQDLKIVSGWVA